MSHEQEPGWFWNGDKWIPYNYPVDRPVDPLNRTMPGGELPREAPPERRLDHVRDQLSEVAGRAGAQVEGFRQDPIGETHHALMKSRDSRLSVEAARVQRSRWQKVTDSAVAKVIRTGVEMIPSPALWGPGDVLTLANGISGFARHKDIISGAPMDKVDSWINVIAAVIPLVPATPVVAVTRRIRGITEDAAYKHRDTIQRARDAHQQHRKR